MFLPATPRYRNHHVNNNNISQEKQQQLSILSPMEDSRLDALMNSDEPLLLIDVRSFAYYSKCRIHGAINLSIPSILLKRPSYTLNKVCESIKSTDDMNRFKQWPSTSHIIFYDHSSENLTDSINTTTAVLIGSKLKDEGYEGHLSYLKGGFTIVSKHYNHHCDSTLIESHQKNKPTLTLPLPTCNSANTKKIANPFFSNIRQNLELSHGPLRERFSIGLPSYAQYHNDTQSVVVASNSMYHSEDQITVYDSTVNPIHIPSWLRAVVNEQTGPQRLAEMYETLERDEQKRLTDIMDYHSVHTRMNNSPTYHPFSIISGLEKGALNRYDNIWPYEYTRVKLHNKTDDYINANYIQYDYHNSDTNLSNLMGQSSGRDKFQSNPTIHNPPKYISTQGPLPTTFNDFWKMIWDENAPVIVMLTQEEEMNKIKCHRYWPSAIDASEHYGDTTVTLKSESKHSIFNMNDKRAKDDEEYIICRKFTLQNREVSRTVTHMQYIGWSDFGVPDSPIGILQLIRETNEELEHCNQGPVVVHCSAGCGRSGAFCAIDTAIYRLTEEGVSEDNDKMLEIINCFRRQRMSMVQTHRQFVFCYEAILWWLLGCN
ncbi:protein-tyrosine phosphatase-like protein [Pilobolus umbonatus]|nr:protein-tyrosine phosphatase-like protein [Pilobolus umbonatus]